MAKEKIEKTADEQAIYERKQKVKAAAYRAKEAEKSKPLRERKKKKISVATPAKAADVDSILENEENIRAFFQEMVELPDEEAIKATIEFFNRKGKGTFGRKKQFQDIITLLPPTLYKDLANEHLLTEKMLDVFWADYEGRPYVIHAIQEKQKREDEEFFKVHEQPSQKKKAGEILLKGRGVVIELDSDGEEKTRESKSVLPREHVVVPITLSIDPLKDGCEEYAKIPWIKNFQEMFISPPEGVKTEDFLKSMSLEAKGARKEDNTTWYKVPPRIITNVLCLNRKFWERDFVRLDHKTKGIINFQIAYLLKDDTFQKQTEKNFRDEKTFVDIKLGRQGNEINKILNMKVTQKIEEFARRILSEWLSNVAPNVKKYKNLEKGEYISETIRLFSISSQNTGKLFEHISKITIFLNNKDGVFTERIIDEYYIPEILVSLSIEEKLPEVFDDPDPGVDKGAATRFIERQVAVSVRNFADQFYKANNPTENIPTLPSANIAPSHVQRVWKSACKNEISKDVQNSSVIYYPENEEIYCILITEVYDQIRDDKKPVNPATGTLLNEKFLKRFRELYDHKFLKPDDVEETVPLLEIKPRPIVESVNRPLIAPWLLETIIKNIKECESEFERDNTKRCKSIENYPHSEDEDDDEDDDKDEDKDDDDKDEDKDDTSEDFSKKDPEERKKLADDLFYSSSNREGVETEGVESEGTESEGAESEGAESEGAESEGAESEGSSEHSPGESPGDVLEGDICQFCVKKLTKKKRSVSPKTIIRNKKGQDKVVWFCDLDCFEKYKCPRSKKKKNNKGGRAASQDRNKK